jgi:hypothetical protein
MPHRLRRGKFAPMSTSESDDKQFEDRVPQA